MIWPFSRSDLYEPEPVRELTIFALVCLVLAVVIGSTPWWLL